jgi:UDP-2-acetamido-3-amino-2,3-dideoxy-glucuronate N-acetyltransferase
MGSINVTMLTHPKNLEGSITILGEQGTVRIGGVAVNEIQHWEFAEPGPMDAGLEDASYATTSVYGFGHPLYYDNVIRTLRGEASPRPTAAKACVAGTADRHVPQSRATASASTCRWSTDGGNDGPPQRHRRRRRATRRRHRVWHFVHVCAGARIGRGCSLGQGVYVGNDVVIGRQRQDPEQRLGLRRGDAGDDVFCGPSMVFTNVHNPRSAVVRKNEYRRTLVRRGATLGANCTIVCGTTVGEHAFVGAGAVVSRDVPDFALMVGVPARRIGWMSRHGERLACLRGRRSHLPGHRRALPPGRRVTLLDCPMQFTDLKTQYAALKSRASTRASSACWTMASTSWAPRWPNWKRPWPPSPAPALHHRGQRHRGAADRADGAGPEAGRRGHHHALHLRRHRRGHRAAGRQAGVRRHRARHLQHRRLADRGQGHAAHPGHHAGQPVRPGGRHGRDQRHRRAARAGGDRGRGAELWRAYQGRAQLQLSAPSAPPASSPASRWAAMATAARCSPTTMRWPRPPRDPRARPERRYHHTRVGVGGRMDTLQCAMVLGKLERFDWELERRAAMGARYQPAAGRRARRLAVRPDRDCVWAPVHGDGGPTAPPCRPRSRRRHAHGRALPEAAAPPAGLRRLCCPDCCPQSIAAWPSGC